MRHNTTKPLIVKVTEIPPGRSVACAGRAGYRKAMNLNGLFTVTRKSQPSGCGTARSIHVPLTGADSVERSGAPLSDRAKAAD